MKKILALLLLSPFASADMDKICTIYLTDLTETVGDMIKKKNCERNNILQLKLPVSSAGKEAEVLLINFANQYCRFDRNTLIKGNTLGCVLYSPQGRVLVRSK
jgi:hypothetical protein